MKCPKCFKEISSNFAYCPYCAFPIPKKKVEELNSLSFDQHFNNCITSLKKCVDDLKAARLKETSANKIGRMNNLIIEINEKINAITTKHNFMRNKPNADTKACIKEYSYAVKHYREQTRAVLSSNKTSLSF